MTDDARTELCSFIIDSFLYGAADELPPDDESLIESEVIDSTGVLELIMYLEDSQGITVDEDDITPANFDSIAGILAYIARQSAPSQS